MALIQKDNGFCLQGDGALTNIVHLTPEMTKDQVVKALKAAFRHRVQVTVK